MEYKAAKDIVNVGDYEGILRCSVQTVTLEGKEKKNFSVWPVKASDKEVEKQSRSKCPILNQEFGCQDFINLNSGKSVMSSKLEAEERHVNTKVSMLMYCHAFWYFFQTC